MNNRTQQRFDRSIDEALRSVQRSRDRRHAEQQARAEEAVRSIPLTRPTPSSVRHTIRLSEADKLRAYEAGVRHLMVL